MLGLPSQDTPYPSLVSFQFYAPLPLAALFAPAPSTYTEALCSRRRSTTLCIKLDLYEISWDLTLSYIKFKTSPASAIFLFNSCGIFLNNKYYLEIGRPLLEKINTSVLVCLEFVFLLKNNH